MATYTSISLSSGTPQYPNQGADHDIWFDAGVLQMCEDGEVVAQRVRQHIEFYQGEWGLNTEAGVPWFQFIYVEPFEQSTAEAILKAAILDVPGVAEILEFDVSIDAASRGFWLNAVRIRTDFNQEVTV